MAGLIFFERGADGTGVVTDATGAVWARAFGGNPLDDGWAQRDEFHRCIDGEGDAPRVIIWSGTTGDELFEPYPSVWQQAAWDRFTQLVDAAAERCEEPGVRILVRTHAHHVLSDAPRCRTLGKQWEGSPMGILLDPRSMIGGSMSHDASDHMTRLADDALVFASAVIAPEGEEKRFSEWAGGDVITLEKSG